MTQPDNPDGNGPDDAIEALIEQVAGAFRERTYQGLHPHPAWFDLNEEQREQAHDRAVRWRPLEAMMDADGYSSTVAAVLSRLRSSRG